MVDYTDFEDLKILREKSFCMFQITSPGHHREKEFFFFREILIIFRGVFKFLLKYAEIFENS
jgi:hypothetical protein